ERRDGAGQEPAPPGRHPVAGAVPESRRRSGGLLAADRHPSEPHRRILSWPQGATLHANPLSCDREARMAVEATDQARVRGFTDDNLGEGGEPAEEMYKRQMLTTPSWQAASIPANAIPKKKGSRIGLTRNKHAQVALNVYQPHRRDEMHCHPGSEHIFLCWQG